MRNPEDLFDDEQLAARGYFVEVEHPELGRKFRYPGAPYLFNGTPWRVYAASAAASVSIPGRSWVTSSGSARRNWPPLPPRG